MKKSKILALVSAMSIVATSMVAIPTSAKETNVNIALGKYAYSSKFGAGSWDGGEHSVDHLVDGDGGRVYVSPLNEGDTDKITIDLLGDYTVNNVKIDTYGNDDPADPFYMSDSTFVVKAKKTKDDAGVVLTRKMNGESAYFPLSGGGYSSYFDIAGTDKYRYIQIAYTEGHGAVDARISEIEVFAPASEANDEATKQIAPVSFGKSVTAGVGATWGKVEGVTDRNVGSNFYAYGRTDGQAWVVIDLGVSYPIKMVAPDMQVGGISDVILSNTSSFEEEEYLDENADGTWTLDESISNNSFRYVKLIPTVAQSSATDKTLSTAYREVVIYSTMSAVNEYGTLKNVAIGSKVTTNGNDQFWSVNNAVDGNFDSQAGLYSASESKYMQVDLGCARDIKKLVLTGCNQWGWLGTGKARTVMVSNDPEFTEYEELLCSARIAPPSHADAVDYKSEWAYAGEKSYRYVRVYCTPGDLCYVQFSETPKNVPCFVISEMEIYATEKSAKLKNIVANKNVTLLNGAWYGDLTGEKLVDSDNSTIAATTGMANIEFDYPRTIKQVEIDLRPGMIDSDKDRRYNVYLSNSGTTEGALQLMSSNSSQKSIMQNTIVLPVETTDKFKYVVFGSDDNFWVLSEVRVMSNDDITKAEYKRDFANGELEAGKTETYTVDFRSPSSIEKNVRPIIARFDDGRLTDVKIGDTVKISGTSAIITIDYTFDAETEVTDKTELKAFVWETDENGILLPIPFCKATVE